MVSFAGLILAKKNSSRLKNKNWRDFKGQPMFVWNMVKCLNIFHRVYVSSDYDYILNIAEDYGAIPIKRPPELLETGNIPVYQHALKYMDKPDVLVAVQANSPTIKQHFIELARDIMKKHNIVELKTCHPDGTDYGSIWAIRTWALEKYEDYKTFKDNNVDVYLTEPSIDIHTQKDFNKALKIKHL